MNARMSQDVVNCHDKLLSSGDNGTDEVLSLIEIKDFKDSILARALNLSRNRYNEVVWEHESETRLSLQPNQATSKLQERVMLIARTLRKFRRKLPFSNSSCACHR